MKLIDYIPEDPLLKSKIFKKLFETRQKYIDEINFNINDLLKQCYIGTATWGIIYWEKEFGLPVDITDTIENRRARCLAHLRGSGNPTIEHIKSVALSYQCGDIDVIEDYENYAITIKFLSVIGIPPKMEDFDDTIRKIVPAHLGISYEFKYNTWGDIFNVFDNWDEVNKYFDSWEEVMTKPINKAEIAKRLHPIFYLDDATNSYKRLTFK